MAAVPFNPLPGNAGGLRYGIGRTAFAGVKSWNIQKTSQGVEVTCFDSATDPNGLIHSQYISGGLVNSTVNFEGVFDKGYTSGTKIGNEPATFQARGKITGVAPTPGDGSTSTTTTTHAP